MSLLGFSRETVGWVYVYMLSMYERKCTRGLSSCYYGVCQRLSESCITREADGLSQSEEKAREPNGGGGICWYRSWSQTSGEPGVLMSKDSRKRVSQL